MVKKVKKTVPKKAVVRKSNPKKKTVKKVVAKKKIVAKKKAIKRVAKKSPKFFNKSEDNPIISPNRRNSWESWQTFNPGVILLDDKVHFLYRAVGQDGLSRLGYAVSADGFKIDERHPKPAYEHSISCRAFSGPFFLRFRRKLGRMRRPANCPGGRRRHPLHDLHGLRWRVESGVDFNQSRRFFE